MFLDEMNISLSRLSDTGCPPRPPPPAPAPARWLGFTQSTGNPRRTFCSGRGNFTSRSTGTSSFSGEPLTSTRGTKSFASCPRPGTAGLSGGAGPEEKAASEASPGGPGVLRGWAPAFSRGESEPRAVCRQPPGSPVTRGRRACPGETRLGTPTRLSTLRSTASPSNGFLLPL